MALMEDWRVPVTRIRHDTSQTDQYGYPLPEADQRVAMEPALFAPNAGSEPAEPGVLATVSQPMLYWPGMWPDIQATDRLEVEGREWHVDGLPERWPMGLAVRLTGAHPKKES